MSRRVRRIFEPPGSKTGFLSWRRYAAARVHFWLLSIAAFVAIETVERGGLSLWVWLESDADLATFLAVLPLGFLQDVSIGFFVGIPFLLGFVFLGRWLDRPATRPLVHGVFVVSLFVLIFFEVSEYFFWGEFDSRLNGIAVFYLIFPREVIGNLQESFNLWLYVPLIAGAALIFYRLMFMGPLARAVRGERSSFLAGRGLALSLAALAGAAIAIRLVNPEIAEGSREVQQLATSGVATFVRAALTNDAEYEGIYPALPDAEAGRLVAADVAQDNTVPSHQCWAIPTERLVRATTPFQPLNVVMVLDESFGRTFMDGDRASDLHGEVAPRVKALARQSLYFSNIYASGNRTVRALEAVFTSFPPIPGISTARRAGSEGMNSLPLVLHDFGYETAMLYGGRAVFDNMGIFWTGIGFDRVLDQADIAEQGFTTAWGVADEYLFSEALRRMDTMTANRQPVFLALLTVSNHRPYTYPAGRIGRNPDEQTKENAAAYADWALGDFIERARAHSWFDDTVFVFMGDHGPRVNGSPVVPVESYRIPLIFYGPKHVSPRDDPVLGSNIDVAPTLLGLIGANYRSPFFGRDLLHVPAGEGRALMEHDYASAYMEGEDVAVLVPSHPPRGYHLTAGAGLQELPAVPEAPFRKAMAIYQTAHAMFYAGAYHQLSRQMAGPLGQPPACRAVPSVPVSG